MDDLSMALAASGGISETEYFVIDNDLRTISIPNSMKIAGVEHDDDINSIPFRMPRYVKGTDLSEFQIRVNYTNALGEGDLYMVEDKVVNDDTISFSWLLDRHAFASKGEITFAVCARLIVENSLVDKEYNTTIHKLTVLQGLETDKAVPVDVQDHFLDWLQEGTETQLSAIQSKGTEVLNSIPEDYTELTWEVGDLKSALPSFAPNSNLVSDGEPTYVTKRTDAAWYRSSDNTVRNTATSGLLSVCIALADIAESVIIDYSGFTGSGSQNALLMAEGASLGSVIDHFWGAKPSSNFGNYGSVDGNLVTVNKSLVEQNSPNTTHLFINISAASGSIKNVLWSNSESVIEIANEAKETANKAQGEIDLIAEFERITPTVVSAGYRLVTNGSCVNDSNYKMLKYAVTAGKKVYIKAALDGVISFQFQTVANVPYTTNPNIVGDPIREAVDGVFTVPANATYVIINAYASNDVSGLYSVKVVSQDSPEASLPTYWQTYLSSKATDIDAAVDNVGNHGDYFSFFTDYHINSNQQHTSLILKTIREAHRIDFDVFGGDALTNHTKANALQFLNKFESDFEHNGFFPLVGNHEKNPYNNAEDVLTDDDIYPILFKRLEMNPKVSLRPMMYYRIDNETQSIRYLFLNTDTASDGADWYLDSAQIQWLEDELNSTPEGWYVVIFTHMFYSNSTGTEIDGIGTLLKRICNAFQSRTTYTSTSASHTFDFTNAKGKMCAIITGHVHADYADTANAYPIIATICDTNQAQQQPSGSTVDRTTGTINEQAIDLFFIDTTAKTISTIRIGAGSDRSFTFA